MLQGGGRVESDDEDVSDPEEGSRLVHTCICMPFICGCPQTLKKNNNVL